MSAPSFDSCGLRTVSTTPPTNGLPGQAEGSGEGARPWWLEALSWVIVGVMAALLGTVGWVVSLGLLLASLGVHMALGLDVSAWGLGLAFAVGLPVGAWLELTDVRWG